MAFNPNLDIEITSVQQTSIGTDLSDSKNTLNAIATITMSNDEKKHLNAINDTRLPKVQRAISEFGDDYPALVGPAVTVARAQKLFGALIFLRDLKSGIAEYSDRIDDLALNIEEILYAQYTGDMYYLAKRYRGKVPGADVVADYLGELFEGQGPQNPTPPTT